MEVVERLLDASGDDLGRAGELHLAQLGDHQHGLRPGRLEVLLVMDGLEHRGDLPDLRGRHRRPHVAVEMDHAALPAGVGIKLGQALDQPEALVADYQAHSGESSVLQVSQHVDPGGLVFLGALHDAENLAESVLVDADRDQDAHVLNLAAPRALQPDPVEEDVRVLALDRPIAPLLDLDGDLLVELADRAGTDPGAPERLGDVLDATHGHTGQVHLHQRLLDADLPAPVALHDRALEWEVPKLRHLERHLARLRMQLAFVMAGPGVDPIRRMLVALRAAKLVCFGIQKGVQRLFHGRYNDFVEVVLDQGFIDGDHVTKRLRLAVCGGRRGIGGHVFVHWSGPSSVLTI